MPSFFLENERAGLFLLNLENYQELLPISKQEKLVQYSPSDIYTPESLERYVQMALADQNAGIALPFLIFDKKMECVAGSTRYMRMDAKNKVLEIGSTWIGREFQGTGLNGAVKNLMIAHAFGPMDYEKIQFRIDERNQRSRKAVEKLGAVLEGICRKDVFLLDGFKRNTCLYGILREDWELG